jgi:mevalonate kinase
VAEIHRFRSHGKLLLTAEYLVLRGATALALPLRMGQTLTVEQKNAGGPGLLTWNAHAPDRLWFKVVFQLPEMNIIETDDMPKAAKLQSILLTLQQLKTNIFNFNTNYKIETALEFEPEWGLGSSSTLIANLALWAGVNPYSLLNFSIGGSGYDVACAMADSPIFYMLEKLRPKIQKTTFRPVFSDKLFFVYLGRKQDSALGIHFFNKLVGNQDLSTIAKSISSISREMAITESFSRFCELSDQHEFLISNILLKPPLATQFPDFNGSIKSLGAWGGDFAMAMSDGDKSELENYFKAKGLHTVFTFDELVLQEPTA